MYNCPDRFVYNNIVRPPSAVMFYNFIARAASEFLKTRLAFSPPDQLSAVFTVFIPHPVYNILPILQSVSQPPEMAEMCWCKFTPFTPFPGGMATHTLAGDARHAGGAHTPRGGVAWRGLGEHVDGSDVRGTRAAGNQGAV